jgi:hypothetical protein
LRFRRALSGDQSRASRTLLQKLTYSGAQGNRKTWGSSFGPDVAIVPDVPKFPDARAPPRPMIPVVPLSAADRSKVSGGAVAQMQTYSSAAR